MTMAGASFALLAAAVFHPKPDVSPYADRRARAGEGRFPRAVMADDSDDVTGRGLKETPAKQAASDTAKVTSRNSVPSRRVGGSEPGDLH